MPLVRCGRRFEKAKKCGRAFSILSAQQGEGQSQFRILFEEQFDLIGFDSNQWIFSCARCSANNIQIIPSMDLFLLLEFHFNLLKLVILSHHILEVGCPSFSASPVKFH